MCTPELLLYMKQLLICYWIENNRYLVITSGRLIQINMFGMAGEKIIDFDRVLHMCKNVSMYRAELMVTGLFAKLVDFVMPSHQVNYEKAIRHALSLLDRQIYSTRHRRKYMKTKVLTVIYSMLHFA